MNRRAAISVYVHPPRKNTIDALFSVPFRRPFVSINKQWFTFRSDCLVLLFLYLVEGLALDQLQRFLKSPPAHSIWKCCQRVGHQSLRAASVLRSKNDMLLNNALHQSNTKWCIAAIHVCNVIRLLLIHFVNNQSQSLPEAGINSLVC
jgi:hypothetical protein